MMLKRIGVSLFFVWVMLGLTGYRDHLRAQNGQSQSQPGGATITNGAAGAASQSYAVSPTCNGGVPGTSGNCTFIYADTRFTTDGATSSSQPTLTSATAAFTSADIGKFAFAVLTGTPGTLEIKGTIISITSATVAVLSNNASANASSLWVAIGHDDGTTIHNAYTSAVAANQGLHSISMPCAFVMVDSGQPLFNNTTTYQTGSLVGCPAGGGFTDLVLGPDFIPSTGCTGVSGTCIWS